MGVSNAAESGAGGAREVEGASAQAGRLSATSTLVEGLLHDARNPLNAISIHLEVLGGKLRDDEGRVPPALEKNLRAMREQITRLDVLLRQFGDFLSQRPNSPESIDVSELVHRLIQVVGYAARTTRVSLQSEIDRELWLHEVDRRGLSQLVLGLLLACIRAAPQGSELVVRLTREDSGALLTMTPREGELNPELGLEESALARLEAERLGVPLELTVLGGRARFGQT